MAELTKLVHTTNAVEYYISVYFGWPNMESADAATNKIHAKLTVSDGTTHIQLACSYYAARTIRGIMCSDNIALLAKRICREYTKDKDGNLWLTNECVVDILHDHLNGRLTG